uniref:Na_H_Exchanger domain-containing protein n=1 Tax=Macrostomum lignano TaxID=282301 RepID=A0A1I8J8C2_9PLAT
SVALRAEPPTPSALRRAAAESASVDTENATGGACSRFYAGLSACFGRVTATATTAENPLPEEPTFWQQAKFSCRCPPHGYVARWITGLVSILVLYGTLIVLVGENALPQTCELVVTAATPMDTTEAANVSSSVPENENSNSTTDSIVTKSCHGGNIFGLFVLFVCSMVASSWSKKLNLPPLLGMLIVGCILGNAPEINVARHIRKEYFNKLRELALCVILLRAGLSLDPNTLRRLSAAVFRLSFVPCLVESFVSAAAARLILGFPWEWGFMLGFVLGAVSPAVVVLGMLKLEYRGYGVEKGIPTLIIAASSMDDVLAITGFSLALGIAADGSGSSGNGSIARALFRGPRDALIGIVYGAAVGALLWYIPHRQHKRPIMFRFIFLVGAGIVALLGCEMVHLKGAGAMAVLTLALVSGYGWRRWDGWCDEKNPMLAPLDTLCRCCSASSAVRLTSRRSSLASWRARLGVVGIGLALRMAASFLCVLGTNLSLRERLFVPFSWLPKATVQAAIGPVALDMALSKQNRNDQEVDWASQILTIAALVILLTAPIGAFLIAFLGPKMLQRDRNWEQHHFELSARQHSGQHTRARTAKAAAAAVAAVALATASVAGRPGFLRATANDCRRDADE